MQTFSSEGCFPLTCVVVVFVLYIIGGGVRFVAFISKIYYFLLVLQHPLYRFGKNQVLRSVLQTLSIGKTNKSIGGVFERAKGFPT